MTDRIWRDAAESSSSGRAFRIGTFQVSMVSMGPLRKLEYACFFVRIIQLSPSPSFQFSLANKPLLFRRSPTQLRQRTESID